MVASLKTDYVTPSQKQSGTYSNSERPSNDSVTWAKIRRLIAALTINAPLHNAHKEMWRSRIEQAHKSIDKKVIIAKE
jgi:hypothetical protein